MASLERTRTRAESMADLWGPAAGAAHAVSTWVTSAAASSLILVGLLGLVSPAPSGVAAALAVALAGAGIWGLRRGLSLLLRAHTPGLLRRLLTRRFKAAGARELEVAGALGAPLGARVILRGRVRALRPLRPVALAGQVQPVQPALPDPDSPGPRDGGAPADWPTRAVWSQVRFSVVPWSPRQRVPLVYDRALDFELVGPDGAAIRVCVADAHLVVGTGDTPRRLTADQAAEARLLALVPPAPGRWVFPGDRTLIHRPRVEAMEHQLADGDEVTVFGALDQVLAPELPRGARETPLEPCVRGLGDRPLIVVAR
jgi:hypothetical protein